MKSEHRHELQTNELGRVAEQAVGFFEAHGNRIMIGVCLVSLAASALILKVRSDRAEEAAAWRDLANARKSEDFADVWERHRGTTAALWARVHEGEGRVSEGVQLMFTNVESGLKELKLAKETLQAVVDTRGAPPEVRERALFHLGRSLEAMSDGSETDAVKAYETLLREFPNSVYKRDAEARIAALGSGSGQEFYAWFSKYERPKPSEKRPRDQVGGTSDNESLIEKLHADDFAIPTEDSDKAMEEESDTDEKPAGEQPADEKPVDEKPADEKPAEDDSNDTEAAKPAKSGDADESKPDSKEAPAEKVPDGEKPAGENDPGQQEPSGDSPADPATP